MKRKLLVALGVVVAIAIAGGMYSFFRSDVQGAQKAADRFAQAWTASQLNTLAFSNAQPADVTTQYRAAIGNLSSMPVHATVESIRVKGSVAHATLDVDWAVGQNNWKYTTDLTLEKGKTWKPVWNLVTIQPDLADGSSLSSVRTQPKRADILGPNGQTLVTDSPVVEVGVAPQRTTDPDGLAKQLAELLDVDANALAAQIKAAKPDAFVSVITLRQSDYDAKKAKLQPLPGTVFRQSTLPLAPTRQFASALLGRVGPVTADMIKSSNGRYVNGDIGGVSGVQAQYDERLSGAAGITVNLTAKDAPSRQLFTVPPIAGQPVQLTIDSVYQNAADNALAGQVKPSAFVAMQASTGNVLAVSNGPGVGGNDNALVGQYPPGSSFKVITTYALLQKGVTAAQNVACPPTITVDGRTFKNAEDEAFASAPFSTDFAKSCNTAFVSLAPKVPGPTLPDAAKAFGIGSDWKLGVPAFSGSVPEPKSPVQLAATAFGQGNTLVSPLAMANVAASVASGTARTPLIVTDPAPASGTSAPLDPASIATLQSLMRQVVTSGTGTAVAHVPGGEVRGKTGTAEFGTDDPPKSHAWFIGYQGDIAFAVFVEGGEFGGDTAAPISAKFLMALPH
jgi:cell division protein FtsI/penicillin-binding protein 2